MSDQWGALELPAQVPGTDDGEGLATAAAGDPCLDVLLEFFEAVLVADLSDMWAARAPASDEQPIVRARFAHDPTACEFQERLLPALFLWRPDSGGKLSDHAEDFLQDVTQLRLWWVMPCAKDPDMARLRAPVINAVAKSLASACNTGRHPAWVLAADSAVDPDAIRLATTNTLVPVTWSGAGLNGVTGGGEVIASRRVTITSSVSVGAFNVTDPVLVTGVLDSNNNGITFTESLYLTNPNGGETIQGKWRFSRVMSITRPGQALAAGTISVGYAASPEALLGSLVCRAAKLSRLEVVSVKPKHFDVQTEDGERVGLFYAAELAIEIQEIEDPDLDASVAAGLLSKLTGTYGAQLTVLDKAGELFSQGNFENP